MIKVIKHLTFLFLALFFLLFAPPVLAAENWTIDNFQSQIDVGSDGKVQVTETIDTDFGFVAKHGIFRDIPYIYYTNNGSNIYTDIQILNVSQDGSAAIYRFSKEGNFLRLKIGDPNRTISGKREYEIKYLVSGVLRGFDDHDELYWDVTGNGWPVLITKASALVTLPQDSITKIACYEGFLDRLLLVCLNNYRKLRQHFGRPEYLRQRRD
ncbi:MAG: DUF2207 domain-containing protein [Candidatus Levybacteria bacterium]|nr:DUF2207 domain-containing protein [Candidatus Levybacteria bacterium]